MKVYALAMEAPGRYVVGTLMTPLADITAAGLITLHFPAHLTVLKDQTILTPIEVVDEFRGCLSHYLGYGKLNYAHSKLYLKWKDMRQNPPSFEVEEGE